MYSQTPVVEWGGGGGGAGEVGDASVSEEEWRGWGEGGRGWGKGG